MSNLSDAKKTHLPTASHSDITFNKNVAAPAKKNTYWSFIQNDLSKAIDTWQVLDNSEIGISPEEEQLTKIKTIIEQLKAKLEQF